MPPAPAKTTLLRAAARVAAIRSFRASSSSEFSHGAVGSGSTENPKATRASKKGVSTCSFDDDAILKGYLSSVIPRESLSRDLSISRERLRGTEAQQSSTVPSSTSVAAILNDIFKPDAVGDNDESADQLFNHATSVLRDEKDQHRKVKSEDDDSLGGVLDFPLLSEMSNCDLNMRRKSIATEKKKRYFKMLGQSGRFGKLAKTCTENFGANVALDLFGRLGQGTSLIEYTSLIKTCLKKARDSTCKDAALEQIYKVYQVFKVVKERGFKIDEEMYGELLLYLIDNGMVDEFLLILEVIKDENHPRLAYYETLLWVKGKNETKIQELFHSLRSGDSAEKCYIQESILLAFADSNHLEGLLMLLETLDITEVISVASLERIFSALGRFSLESHAERFLLALKTTGIQDGEISSFISKYTFSIPNLAVLKVDDIILKFQGLHAKFEVLPTSALYEALVNHYCERLEVHDALAVVDDAFNTGVTLSLKPFHRILDACDHSCEFNLVREVFSRICRHNLKPHNGTFKRAVLLCVKMKDFEGAYEMIEELKNMGLEPTSGMYNAILGGYFREKNSLGAVNVLKQMEKAGVEPDSATYSYFISNSRSEKDIIKFHHRMIKSGVQPTKHVFMALINAHASCGQMEKARQVITDERILGQDLNEIKSVLVAALASNDQLPAALEMHEEIKGPKGRLDWKTIKCLIEHCETEDVLDKAFQLFDELSDSVHWTAAFFSIMSCCLRFENSRGAANLLKRLKDKFIDDEAAISVMFDEIFCMFAEKEPTHMHFGLSLLELAKQQLGVDPTRKSLDFLLSACVTAKDSSSAFLIWNEYEAAGLPHNVLCFIRMYQTMLASGDIKSARKILKNVPMDDPHVCCVINACKKVYKLSDMRK